MSPRDLPILEIRDRLLMSLREHRRLILTAPTGSGKSTQVPQMLLDGGLLGDGQVVILQPRRLPARLLAAWVANDHGGKLGEEVGYQIRFDDATSPATRIRYVTEGVLLRQMLSDPTLPGVSAIIFDEFHERHLYGDITLARALQVQETVRPDLFILAMSATLDVGPLQKFLEPCTVLSSVGRTFPVEVEYLAKPVGDWPVWEAAVHELEQLVKRHAGDALVFMPGAYEIGRTVQAARDALGNKFIVLPLHGDLPTNDQDAAVARYDRRKVVVSTNVAETSLTIDGVRIVIDSGLARIPRYDPYRGINTLLVEKISRASADQRAGRAGRTAPGVCLRLWTGREHEQRPAQELPEVKRLDLAEVVLTLKASGVDDVHSFRWLEPPNKQSLERAENLLTDLGALSRPSPESPSTSAAAITDLGRRMLAFPLHPRYARMLLAAQEYGCVRPVALIAALTQGRDLLVRRQGREVADARDELLGGGDSDFFVLMRAWRFADRNGYNLERCRHLGIHAQAARQVGPLFEQFLGIANREGLDVSEKRAGSDAIQRCILLGFSDHVARRLDAGTLRCELVHGRRGLLARESVVSRAGGTPLLVAAEVREVQSGTGKDKEVNVLLSLATAVKEDWLRELFPGDFRETHEVIYDTARRRVFAERRKSFRDLVLQADRSELEVGQASRLSTPQGWSAGTPDPLNQAARILADEVLAGRCPLKNWDDAVEQWIVRVNRLREWMPQLDLPAIAEDDRRTLIQQICHGALGYKEIKDRPVWPILRAWLTSQQQAWVDEYTPERIELRSGRRAKVTYSADGPPTIAARIQDLYGTNALAIAAGRIPVRIQVLAPNHRPVQVTDNLATFWRETYPKLKQELQRKYPKHEWR
ncbi:MAG TPA: ATP-dependent helicase HrpB [Verrucomicrobiae bacterium]|nr:ATP-dependent helicase HrpB [Verrucomicrobiae bacterium]